MNKKGFTLIELLSIIVIIALVAVLVAPTVINYFNTVKNKSYDILINNIKVAAENFYKEYEFGTVKCETKDDYICSKNDDTITANLKYLAKYGNLKGGAQAIGSKFVYDTIKDPKTRQDISDCEIKIIKSTEGSLTTYAIQKADNRSKCPPTSDYN